jgi:Asp-tRNA(Asn)/Glu-tRNA(Gln) amidotransferase A subunit family amidase
MSGVHGLATTFGRCPFEKPDSTLVKSGPLATSAADVAIGYSVMSQNNLSHFYSVLYDGGYAGPPVSHVTGYHNIEDLSDVRVGIFQEWFNDSDEHIRKQCYKAVEYLKSKGVKVVDIKIPHMAATHLAHGIKISNEFALAFDRAYHASPSG